MLMEYLPVILTTAALSSLLTLIGGFLVFKWFLEVRLEKELEESANTFETQLRQGLEETGEALIPEFRTELEAAFKEAAQELLPEFREELKSGFHEAGMELLPELRAEVRKGFKEAVVDVISGEVAPNAVQSIARKLIPFWERKKK